MRATLCCIVIALGTACHRAPPVQSDLVPATLLGGHPAIPYPPDLFGRRIEGEVLLYLVIDSSGSVVRDSTRIAKSSGQTEFDAAALQAAASLRFNPARRDSIAVTAPIQIPIQFTLPDSLKPTRKTP